MTGRYTALWQSVFVLALALELPLVAAFAPRGRRLRAIAASLIGNAVTHPLLWFVWPRWLPSLAALLVGEGFAIGFEALSLATIGGLERRRALAVATAVNLYSWALGEWIMRAVGPRLADYWFRV